MRQRCLALLSVFAAMTLANPGYAISLNPRGLGQVLIYPYYTVNKGQDTLVSIANESDTSRMTKIRFNEGMNGRPVMDFLAYIAPHDVWTARVSQLADDGGAALYTTDTTCVYPPIEASGFAFRKSAYAGGSVFPADGGPTGVSRTREGFFEVYEVGTVVPDSPLDFGVRRLDGQAAPACTGMIHGYPSEGSLTEPRGGLSGSATIVNVGEGTFFSYAAQALAGYSRAELCCGFGVEVGPEMTNSADSAYPGGAIAHVQMNDHEVALDFGVGRDAFSAVLMADTIANDYLVAAGLGAHTDWIITFPTKPLYTDSYYVLDPQGQPPFVEKFHAPGVSNLLANVAQYDQEEGHGTTSTLTLPWVVNVLSLQSGDDAASSVLGSALTVPVAPFAYAGTMTLDLAHGGEETHTISVPDGRVLHGLPATGFMVYNIINADAAPGKLANYGGVFPYRSTVSCTTSVDDSTPCE